MTTADLGPLPSLPGPTPERWDALAVAGRNLFATHAFAACWWEVYGSGREPVVLCDDEAEPRVVLALAPQGRLLRQVRLVGHGPADILSPACAPADLAMAGQLLTTALRGRGATLRADVVLLQDVPIDDRWWAPLPAQRIRVEPSPVLDLAEHGSWEGYLAARSRNFRGQVRRRAAKLEREHDVVVRLASAETLDDDLATLADLHRQRWGGDTLFLEPDQQRLTARFARVALERGWLRLRTMELDGRAVASTLGFAFAGDEYYYQAGRLPELDRLSVGFCLQAHGIREAAEEGAREYRFLRGDEDYKRRFTTDSADVATYAVALTARGRAAVRVAARRRERAATESRAEDDAQSR